MLVAVPALATIIVLVRHILIDRAYGEGRADAVALEPAVLVTTREMPAVRTGIGDGVGLEEARRFAAPHAFPTPYPHPTL